MRWENLHDWKTFITVASCLEYNMNSQLWFDLSMTHPIWDDSTIFAECLCTADKKKKPKSAYSASHYRNRSQVHCLSCECLCMHVCGRQQVAMLTWWGYMHKTVTMRYCTHCPFYSPSIHALSRWAHTKHSTLPPSLTCPCLLIYHLQATHRRLYSVRPYLNTNDCLAQHRRVCQRFYLSHSGMLRTDPINGNKGTIAQ